jgi:hypothetical protein
MIGLNGQASRDEKGKDQGWRREGSWYAIAAGVLPSVKRRELVEQMSQCRELTRAFRFVFNLTGRKRPGGDEQAKIRRLHGAVSPVSVYF